MNSACPSCGAPSGPQGTQLAGHDLYCCSECSLRFAPGAVGLPVDYERIYESPEYLASQVDVIGGDFDPAQFLRHGTYRAFFEHAPRPWAEATLIDLGCGVGRFCYAAHHVGWRVMGVDVSEKAINVGRKRAPFPLRQATAADMLNETQRFDAVTAFEVLEHLPRPVEFLKQALALTRPGGLVFCTVPNWECSPVQQATRPDWVPPVHLNFFTQAALRRAGELAALESIETGLIRTERPALSWKRKLLEFGRAPSEEGEALGLWLLGRRGTS